MNLFSFSPAKSRGHWTAAAPSSRNDHPISPQLHLNLHHILFSSHPWNHGVRLKVPREYRQEMPDSRRGVVLQYFFDANAMVGLLNDDRLDGRCLAGAGQHYHARWTGPARRQTGRRACVVARRSWWMCKLNNTTNGRGNESEIFRCDVVRDVEDWAERGVITNDFDLVFEIKQNCCEEMRV